MSTHIRLKAAAATAVLAGLIAAPAAVPASASAATAHRVSAREPAAIRAAVVRAHDEQNPIAEIISELELDVSPGNIEAILGDLPGFPPYGSLL